MIDERFLPLFLFKGADPSTLIIFKAFWTASHGPFGHRDTKWLKNPEKPLHVRSVDHGYFLGNTAQ